MGCICSSKVKPLSVLSYQKDTKEMPLKSQKRETKEYNYKILLLGALGSGKSTILKQMRKLYGDPITQNEYIAVKTHLSQNIIEIMRCLAVYSDILYDSGNETNVDVTNIQRRNNIAKMKDNKKLTEQDCNDFYALWCDNGIQNTLKHRQNFQLICTYKYLVERMNMIWRSDYIPNFNDYIHSQQRTTGVNQINFTIERNEFVKENYSIFDFGGAKNERRKWIHFFQNTSVILYVVSLIGYYQVLWEDQKKNRMREAIGLFRSIVNIPRFKDKPIIILFNKYDLFCESIKQYPVTKYFKSFDGNPNDEIDIINFFKNKFLKQRNENIANKQIPIHVIDSIDSECIESVWTSIMSDNIVKSSYQ